MQPDLVVLGHSHAEAYAPSTDDRAEPAAVAIDGGAAIVGPLPRGDDYWALAEARLAGRVAAIVWEGRRHLDAFLVAPTPPIDFVLSLAPDLPLDPRASYVAEAQVEALFAPSLAGLAPLIERLRAAGAADVLVAGTPPPIGDPAILVSRARADPTFAAAIEDGTTPALTSIYTLQKLWSLTQTMLATAARDAGAAFVPVPDTLRGTDGFLRQRFWGEDIATANAAFAAEMVAALTAAAADAPRHGNPA